MKETRNVEKEVESEEGVFKSDFLNQRLKDANLQIDIDDNKKSTFNEVFARFLEPTVISNVPNWFKFNDQDLYEANVLAYHQLLEFLSGVKNRETLAMELTFTFGNFDAAIRYLSDHDRFCALTMGSYVTIPQKFNNFLSSSSKNIQLKVKEGANPALWWKILQQHLSQPQDPLSNVQDPVALLLPFAKDIEKMVQDENKDKNIDISKIPLSKLIEYASRCKYKKIDEECPPDHENRKRVLNSGAIAFKLQYPESSFNYLDLTHRLPDQALKPIPLEYLDIPDIKVEGVGNNSNYYIRRLDPTDPRAPFLRTIVRGIIAPNRDSMMNEKVAGITDPDSAFYILCEKKGAGIVSENDPILAYSLASKGMNGEIALDSIYHHQVRNNAYPQIAHDLFIQLGIALVNDYDIPQVLVKFGNQSTDEKCFDENHIYHHPENKNENVVQYGVLAVRGLQLYDGPSTTTNFGEYPFKDQKLPYPELRREKIKKEERIERAKTIERERDERLQREAQARRELEESLERKKQEKRELEERINITDKFKVPGISLNDDASPTHLNLLRGDELRAHFILETQLQPKQKRGFFEKLFSTTPTRSPIDTETILAEVYQAKNLNDKFLANACKIRLLKGKIDFNKAKENARADGIPLFYMNEQGACEFYIKTTTGNWEQTVFPNETEATNEIFKILKTTRDGNTVITPVADRNSPLITQLNALLDPRNVLDPKNKPFNKNGYYYNFLKNYNSDFIRMHGRAKARIIASTYNQIFPAEQNSPFPRFTVKGKEVARNSNEARSINNAVKLHSDLADDVLNKYVTVKNEDTEEKEVFSYNEKYENKTLPALIERFNDYINNRKKWNVSKKI